MKNAIARLLHKARCEAPVDVALAAFRAIDKRIVETGKPKLCVTGILPPKGEWGMKGGDKVTIETLEGDSKELRAFVHGVFLCEEGDYIAIRPYRFDGFLSGETFSGIAIVLKSRVMCYSRYTPSINAQNADAIPRKENDK